MVSECKTQLSRWHHPRFGRSSRSHSRPLFYLTAVLLAALPQPTDAQGRSLWIDALASTALPPARVFDQSVGVYGMLGARANYNRPLLDLGLASYIGVGENSDDGRWGALAANATRDFQFGSLNGSGELELFGVHYAEPFSYTAGLLSGRPRLSHAFNGFEATVTPELGIGFWRSSSPLSREPNPARLETQGTLRLAALRGTVAAPFSKGAVALTATAADAHNGVANGTYLGVNLGLAQVVRGMDVTGDIAWLNGPLKTEAGITVTVGRAFGERTYVSADVGRRVGDIALGSAGHFGATLGVSWRPGRSRVAPAERPQIVVIGMREARGTRVEFTLPATQAQTAAVVGSFTGWKPRQMTRTANGWTISMLIPTGAHQFSFLLDGDRWYLPEGAPGVVDDGFGRKNATLVIGVV